MSESNTDGTNRASDVQQCLGELVTVPLESNDSLTLLVDKLVNILLTSKDPNGIKLFMDQFSQLEDSEQILVKERLRLFPSLISKVPGLVELVAEEEYDQAKTRKKKSHQDSKKKARGSVTVDQKPSYSKEAEEQEEEEEVDDFGAMDDEVEVNFGEELSKEGPSANESIPSSTPQLARSQPSEPDAFGSKPPMPQPRPVTVGPGEGAIQTPDIANPEQPPQKPKTSKREVLVDYFSRMNLLKVYPVTVVFSKKEIEVLRDRSDVLTGERRSQVKEEVEISELAPIEVELSFPGCLVTPATQEIDPEMEKSYITFHVTPLAKGSIKGLVRLTQGFKVLADIELGFAVVDQRLAKVVSLAGLLFAGIPTAWNYVFGVDINEHLASNLTTILPALTSPTLLIIELLFGLGLIGLALAFFWKYSSKRQQLTALEF